MIGVRYSGRNMRNSLVYQCIFWMLVCSSSIFSQSKYSEIEKFFDVVGYVYDEKVVTKKVLGKMEEVWYRNVDNGEPKPKMRVDTGSCFFITTLLDFYLVTAEHVAKNTSFNTQIIISSQKDTPIKFNLRDMVAEKDTLNWTTHPEADVAVIQLAKKFVKKTCVRILFPLKP